MKFILFTLLLNFTTQGSVLPQQSGLNKGSFELNTTNPIPMELGDAKSTEKQILTTQQQRENNNKNVIEVKTRDSILVKIEDNNTNNWYANPTNVIAFFGMLFTTALGVATFCLTRSIAKSNQKISSAQVKTAESALKLQLFEKRIKAYDAAKEYMYLCANASRFTSNVDLAEMPSESTNEQKEKNATSTSKFSDVNVANFLNTAHEAHWLFSNGVKIYFDEIYNKSVELINTQLALSDNLIPSINQEREDLANKHYELRKWFHDQLSEIDKKLGDDLKIHK